MVQGVEYLLSMVKTVGSIPSANKKKKKKLKKNQKRNSSYLAGFVLPCDAKMWGQTLELSNLQNHELKITH
jgi:hypothetical protein